LCSSNLTTISNIADLGNGNYSINFTAPSPVGTFNLSCNGSRSSNLGISSELYYTEPYNTTILLALSPAFTVTSNITFTQNFTYGLNITFNNTGEGTASDSRITLLPSDNNITTNITFFDCGDVSPLGQCTTGFTITALENTPPGEYIVNITVNWTNTDLTQGIISNLTNISILSNPIIMIAEDEANNSIGHWDTFNSFNFTVSSIGNNIVNNISLACVSGTICSAFSPVLSQSNISSLTNGDSQLIQMNLTIPAGYTAGNYSGLVNMTSVDDGYDTINLTLEVQEVKTWNMTPLSCSKIILVDVGGDICSVTLNNSGNVQLDFNVSPASIDFTSSNESSFSINKQESRSFLISYNTTNISQAIYYHNYTVNSSTVGASPALKPLSLTLDVVFGPIMATLTGPEVEQQSGILITSNISDRSAAGISWVMANITKPNNEVDIVNLTNMTANEPGAYSIWQFNYTNTSQRGIHQVSIYSKDVLSGVGQVSDEFIVYALLNITSGTQWDDYLLGETASLDLLVTDVAGNKLAADVNLSIYDAENQKRFTQEYQTNENGQLDIVPTYQIPSDGQLGSYLIAAYAQYNDTLGNRTLNLNENTSFGVYNTISTNIDTQVVWYPSSVMTFFVMVYSQGNSINESNLNLNLTVLDPAQALYTDADKSSMSIVQQTDSSVLYMYQYAMPISTSSGSYLSILEVKQGSRPIYDIHTFRVSTGGPYDLVTTINQNEVGQGTYVPFDIGIWNMGELSQDVYLDYWVEAQSGGTIYSRVQGEAVYVAAADNQTFARNLFIYTNQPLGNYDLIVRMNYSTIQSPIQVSNSFRVVQATSNETEPSAPAGGGGGGGGGGASPTGASVATETIVIKELTRIVSLDLNKIDPEVLEIERGGVSYITQRVKNIGQLPLSNVRSVLSLENMRANFFSENSIPILAPGEEGILIIKSTIPSDASVGEIMGKILISSGEITLDEGYPIRIFDSKENLYKYQITTLKARITKIRTQAEKDAGSYNINIDEILGLISEAEGYSMAADENLNSKEFFKFIDNMKSGNNMLEKAEYLLDNLKQETILRYSFMQNIMLIALTCLILFGIYAISRMRRRGRAHPSIFHILKWKLFSRKSMGGFRKKYIKKNQADNAERLNPREKKHISYALEDQLEHGYISQEDYDRLKEVF
ncbi:hypothetical protein ACFLYT_01335, partial [Nanoarchaeota archaeon]